MSEAVKLLPLVSYWESEQREWAQSNEWALGVCACVRNQLTDSDTATHTWVDVQPVLFLAPNITSLLEKMKNRREQNTETRLDETAQLPTAGSKTEKFLLFSNWLIKWKKYLDKKNCFAFDGDSHS